MPLTLTTTLPTDLLTAPAYCPTTNLSTNTPTAQPTVPLHGNYHRVDPVVHFFLAYTSFFPVSTFCALLCLELLLLFQLSVLHW